MFMYLILIFVYRAFVFWFARKYLKLSGKVVRPKPDQLDRFRRPCVVLADHFCVPRQDALNIVQVVEVLITRQMLKHVGVSQSCLIQTLNVISSLDCSNISVLMLNKNTQGAKRRGQSEVAVIM